MKNRYEKNSPKFMNNSFIVESSGVLKGEHSVSLALNRFNQTEFGSQVSKRNRNG